LNYINLNGKITNTADVVMPIDNGAFRYGYGLFETMLVQEGTISLFQYHMERLFGGLKQLGFELPALMTAEYMEEEVLKTVKKNKMDPLSRVRLQVFAGGGGLYGTGYMHPGFVIECFPLDESTLQLNTNGLVVGIATGIGKCSDALSNLKSCNALIYAVAARQAKEQKWNDALICNTKSYIIESTIANIFWIKDGVVYTPPLSEGCVAGVMRQFILDKTKVTKKRMSIGELMYADEVFLTNAIKKIQWVGAWDDTKYGNEQTRAIYELLNRP
jgi:branched-chain amino acid aminotransferase